MTWLCPMSILNRYTLKRSFLINRVAEFFFEERMAFVTSPLFTPVFYISLLSGNLSQLDSILKVFAKRNDSVILCWSLRNSPNNWPPYHISHAIYTRQIPTHVHSYPNSSVMPFHHIPAAGSELKIIKKSITREVKSKAVCWLPWITEILCLSP